MRLQVDGLLSLLLAAFASSWAWQLCPYTFDKPPHFFYSTHKKHRSKSFQTVTLDFTIKYLRTEYFCFSLSREWIHLAGIFFASPIQFFADAHLQEGIYGFVPCSPLLGWHELPGSRTVLLVSSSLFSVWCTEHPSFSLLYTRLILVLALHLGYLCVQQIMINDKKSTGPKLGITESNAAEEHLFLTSR